MASKRTGPSRVSGVRRIVRLDPWAVKSLISLLRQACFKGTAPSGEGSSMKKHLGAAAAVFTLTFSSLAIAQVGQSSDSLSHLNRPAPPPTAQMSPEATVAAAKQRIEADKKTGRLPDRKTLQMLLSAQSQLKDEAGMADTLEEEAADYNDPADWTEIIAIALGTPGLRDQDGIWLGRLLF